MKRLALFVPAIFAAALACSRASSPADAASVGDSATPAPPPPPLLEGGTPAEQACSKLAAWGCATGKLPTCVATFELPANFGAPPACVLGASSPDELLSRCGITCSK